MNQLSSILSSIHYLIMFYTLFTGYMVMPPFLCDVSSHDEMTTDSPTKKHCCSLCIYATNDKSNYMKHLSVHTGIKPFKCPECQLSFRLKHHIKKHMRTHEMPFKCTKCSERFRQKWKFDAHVCKV